MRLEIPEIKDVLPRVLETESTFDNNTQFIVDWIASHRKNIQKNKLFLQEKTEKNDLKILGMYVKDLLNRNVGGEVGIKAFQELESLVATKKDLCRPVYEQVVKNINYRWGVKTGMQVLEDAVYVIENKLNWDWKSYFRQADDNYKTNFPQDPFLEIKNVGMKVRDLALSNFSEYFVAFDVHVPRVITRIGLLNTGFDLLDDPEIEMGNNAMNPKQYLFLHHLVMKWSKDIYCSMSDLDRAFWHFGRAQCKARPKCKNCSIYDICLTGKYS